MLKFAIRSFAVAVPKVKANLITTRRAACSVSFGWLGLLGFGLRRYMLRSLLLGSRRAVAV